MSLSGLLSMHEALGSIPEPQKKKKKILKKLSYLNCNIKAFFAFFTLILLQVYSGVFQRLQGLGISEHGKQKQMGESSCSLFSQTFVTCSLEFLLAYFLFVLKKIHVFLIKYVIYLTSHE
jgi:hypothetical protein